MTNLTITILIIVFILFYESRIKDTGKDFFEALTGFTQNISKKISGNVSHSQKERAENDLRRWGSGVEFESEHLNEVYSLINTISPPARNLNRMNAEKEAYFEVTEHVNRSVFEAIYEGFYLNFDEYIENRETNE